MSDELEYGIKFTTKDGRKDTMWYDDEKQRDKNIAEQLNHPMIKKAKPVQRKKKRWNLALTMGNRKRAESSGLALREKETNGLKKKSLD
jgi:hypothetical protein